MTRRATQSDLHHQQQQTGFTLLEVLVALLILSFGLLGLAALQTFGLRFTHQSYERTQATYLIEDIVERMRANPIGTQNGDYLIARTNNPAAAGASSNCLTANCSSQAMARYDLERWITTVTRTLALGEVEITRTVGPAFSLYDIRVFWQENDMNMAQRVVVQLP